MKIKTLGLLVLAASTLFILVFAIVIFLHWPFSRLNIQQSLEATFGGSITFQNVHSTYFPNPGCTIDNLVFKQGGVPASTPPLVTIAQLRIEVRYLDLLLRPGYLARVRLNNFFIHIPADRHSLLSSRSSPSTTRVGEIIADGSTIQVDRENSAPSLIFDIHTLRLFSVGETLALSYITTLHIPLPPGEVHAKGKFGPWSPVDPRQTPVSGEYSCQGADLAVFKGISGSLSSEDNFHGTLGRIEAHGTVDVPNFTVTRSHHSVHLQGTFHSFIDGTNGDVKLQRVDAGFLGTSISANGEIAHHSDQEGKLTSIDLIVRNGRIGDVLYLFVRKPEAPLHGTTNFRAHIIIPPDKRPFLHRIRIIGDFGIEEGRFANPATQDSVNVLSERARGAKKEQPSDSETAISDLAGHIELHDANANLHDLRFYVPGASANMNGTYNLESTKIDLHGTLKTDVEISKMTTGVKSVLLKPFDSAFRKKRAAAVIPVHLLGTFDHPEPGLDIPARPSDRAAPH